MKQILILSVLTLLISISISIVHPNKEKHSHQEPPKKHIYPTKERKKCKSYERLRCDKNDICFCVPFKKCGTSDLMIRRSINRTKYHSTGGIKCRPGYRKCYEIHSQKYHCYSNLLNITCLSGPKKNWYAKPIRHKK